MVQLTVRERRSIAFDRNGRQNHYLPVTVAQLGHKDVYDIYSGQPGRRPLTTGYSDRLSFVDQLNEDST